MAIKTLINANIIPAPNTSLPLGGPSNTRWTSMYMRDNELSRTVETKPCNVHDRIWLTNGLLVVGRMLDILNADRLVAEGQVDGSLRILYTLKRKEVGIDLIYKFADEVSQEKDEHADKTE